MIFTLAVLGVAAFSFLVAFWPGGEKRQPTPCPYCPNPDRDTVLDDWRGCQYDSKGTGADPPCVCDDYFTPHELSRDLGLGS